MLLPQYTDAILDIETFDIKESAVILSVGLAPFDITKAESAEQITARLNHSVYKTNHIKFSWNLDVDQQVDKGRTLDPSTVGWWLQQSKEAREQLNGPSTGILDFTDQFSRTINMMGIKYLWGNGCGFDNRILRDLFSNYGRKFPIEFRNDNDVRTVKRFGMVDVGEQSSLEKHVALDDAIYEVMVVQQNYKSIVEDR